MYDKNITIAIWMSPLQSSITVGVNARVGEVELLFPYIVDATEQSSGAGLGCQGQVVRAVKDVVSLLANIPDANIPDGLLVEPSLQAQVFSLPDTARTNIRHTTRTSAQKKQGTQAVWE